MMTTRRAVLTGASLLTSASFFGGTRIAAAQPVEPGGAPEPAAGPLETAILAYIYGYPLVTVEMTRRVTTNTVKPEGLHGPMGQFASAREYPTAAFKDVTAPTADTLYSSGWLDLSQGPWILQLPDEHGRYYLMPMLEAWTNVFASPGTRTAPASLRSSAPAGTVNSPPAARSFGRAQISSGLSGVPIAPARRRITRRCTRSRTNTSSCRSAATANRTRRRPEKSTLRST